MIGLIIDDSVAIRISIRKILIELGIEYIEAGNGQQALEILKSNPAIDFALVDWNMPVMDGYEFLQKVRADHSYDKKKLIMVTTHSDMESMIKAMKAGANEYVMKPFDKEILKDKLVLAGLEL
ncbi:MAG: response regulator [Leptospiraceae bacterium]|nr:response regulator [Leptospiraceae bacterium]